MSRSKEELIIGFFEKGYCCDLDEVKNTCLDLLKENQKYKEVIDKAIEILKLCNSQCAKETIDILKEVE